MKKAKRKEKHEKTQKKRLWKNICSLLIKCNYTMEEILTKGGMHFKKKGVWPFGSIERNLLINNFYFSY